ncbi:MAG: DMT family transporter [Alphaproteobacteria bacterium]
MTDDPRRGIAYAVAFGALILGMDALVKHLTALYPVAMIIWARYVFHVATTPLLGLKGGVRGLLATARPALQAARSLCMLGATVTFFGALAYIPLADAIAISFVAPFLITLLAVPVLGERVGPRRIAACGLGFLGALLIIRPGFEARHWAYLLPLGTAVAYAFYGILTRRLGAAERPTTSLFYTASIGALVSCAFVPFHWVAPDATGWFLLAAVGVIAAVGHLLLIQAYRLAPASLVAPFGYLDMVWATLYGLILFDEFPDRLTWIGIAVIVGSGLYVFRRAALVPKEHDG